jgi:hypothetical protein
MVTGAVAVTGPMSIDGGAVICVRRPVWLASERRCKAMPLAVPAQFPRSMAILLCFRFPLALLHLLPMSLGGFNDVQRL